MRIVHCKRDPFDVYVGRSSRWGNPYTVTEHGLAFALTAFEALVRSDPDYRREARYRLDGLTLACWCAPKGGVDIDGPLICHGQILARSVRGDYED